MTRPRWRRPASSIPRRTDRGARTGCPAPDASGNVYLLAGNGTFDITLNGGGFPSLGDFGNAFLKVSTSSGLAVSDYFATFDTVSKSDSDIDLGSGGTLVLPDLLDASNQVQHLA